MNTNFHASKPNQMLGFEGYEQKNVQKLVTIWNKVIVGLAFFVGRK